MTMRNALSAALVGLPLAAAAAPAPITVINGATIIHPSRTGAAAVEEGATIVISGDRIQLAGAGITLELPQGAKIIDARREPMACCFSNFKQLFANGQPFTYSLDDLGRYYRGYVRLMEHWDAVLPGRVLRVQHEDVIDDLEGNVRRMLNFCGLGYEPACVDFHRTERRVHTASSEQVRRPITREGVDQWRHFEPWLGDLRAALGPIAPA